MSCPKYAPDEEAPATGSVEAAFDLPRGGVALGAAADASLIIWPLTFSRPRLTKFIDSPGGPVLL